MKKLLIFVSLMFLISCGKEEKEIDAYHQDLINLRNEIEKNLDMPLDDFEKAIVLRNHIYEIVRLESTKSYDFTKFTKAYKEAYSGEVGHICGGIAILYITALEAFGIPARYVGLFYDNGWTHAVSEFYYKGSWYASDATFNVMFYNNGYLSYEDIYYEDFVLEDNGYDTLEGAQEYYDMDIAEMGIHPAKVNGVNHNEVLIPEGFINPTVYRGVYKILGRGYLR